jgi:ATP-binding cassette subfamily B protein
MDHGEIVGIGKHEELVRDCKVYQEIYQSQVGKEVAL